MDVVSEKTLRLLGTFHFKDGRLVKKYPVNPLAITGPAFYHLSGKSNALFYTMLPGLFSFQLSGSSLFTRL
ncbi:TPA: hypothetical protein JLG79_004434 [Escherichia coli]|nr:hypothetical protein [Escherichia coli]HAV9637090.1 hypothetical protein [Escherichia coli]HAV9655467.1 hypothetical protein [Escherichia coli]HDL9614646.1 hypothetical protein [Escherichia coli]